MQFLCLPCADDRPFLSGPLSSRQQTEASTRDHVCNEWKFMLHGLIGAETGMARIISRPAQKVKTEKQPRKSKSNKAIADKVKDVQIKVVHKQRKSQHTSTKPNLRTETSDEIVVVPRQLNSRFIKAPKIIAAARPSNLLRLPKELQIKIFHFALGTSSPHLFFCVCNDSLMYNTTRSAALAKRHGTPPLLLTSREVHEYASTIFLRDAVFHVHCYSNNDEEFRLMAQQAAIQPLGRLKESQISSRARIMHLDLHLEEVVDFESCTHVIRRLVTVIGRGRALYVLRICLICDWRIWLRSINQRLANCEVWSLRCVVWLARAGSKLRLRTLTCLFVHRRRCG